MRVIGFTGKAYAGKDTCADYLCSTYAYRRAALALPLKQMLHAGLGLDPKDFVTAEQKETIIPWLGVSYRHAAQTLGTDWGRKLIHSDLWLIVLERTLYADLKKTDCPGLVLSDVRFENEAAWIRKVGGSVLHVQRNVESGMGAQAKAHASEQGVSFVAETDRLLFNYGTVEQLHRSIDTALNHLRGGV